LSAYFPWDNENTRRFLKRINLWVQDKRRLDTLGIPTLKAILKAGSEGFLPAMQPFISCAESGEGLRGYPCSMWLLFHVLTVREYGVQKSKMNTGHASFSHQVLPAMRSYMMHFFSCFECAEHFTEASEKLTTDLKEPRDSVIWLWEMHNSVNHRLAGQPSEDPAHPKRDFPPKNLCNACKRNKSKWNEDEVLHFMLQHYSHQQLHRAGKKRYTNRGGSDLGVDLTFGSDQKSKKNDKKKKSRKETKSSDDDEDESESEVQTEKPKNRNRSRNKDPEQAAQHQQFNSAINSKFNLLIIITLNLLHAIKFIWQMARP
jgi:hypothetical protein